MTKEIEYYVTVDGKCPFIEWYNELAPLYQAQIIKRINRLEDGLYGDCKRLSNSQLSELRVHLGKGYRIYFKELDDVIILIVTGSDKKDQQRTIKQADKYLQDYIDRSKE